MQVPKSNVVPLRRTAPVDPKFLMMAAAMMKGEGKLNPKLDPKDVEAGAGMPAGRSLDAPIAQRPQRSSGSPLPGQVMGSSVT